MKLVMPKVINMQHHIERPHVKCLTDSLIYGVGDTWYKINPPFWWDGASFPRITLSILGGPFSGPYVVTTLWHDVAYAARLYEHRMKVEHILYEMLRLEGCPWLKRQAIYRGLIVGGWIEWNRKTEEMIEGALKHVEIHTSQPLGMNMDDYRVANYG